MMILYLGTFTENPLNWLWLLGIPAIAVIFYFCKKIEWSEDNVWATSEVAGKYFVKWDEYLVWDERKELYKRFKITEGEEDKHIGWEPKDFLIKDRS